MESCFKFGFRFLKINLKEKLIIDKQVLIIMLNFVVSHGNGKCFQHFITTQKSNLDTQVECGYQK
jgi:hypothetical protein